MRDLEYKVHHLRLSLEDCSTCLLNDTDPNLTSACVDTSDDEGGTILDELRSAKDSLAELQFVFPDCDDIHVGNENSNTKLTECDDVCGNPVIDHRNLTDILIPGMGGVHAPLVQKWLQENFEEDFEAMLPRGQVYKAYLACCELYGIKPVNAATFGKVVRTVFPNVRTRRIGVRGQSRYQYCGIGIRNSKRPKHDGTERFDDMELLLQACILSGV